MSMHRPGPPRAPLYSLSLGFLLVLPRHRLVHGLHLGHGSEVAEAIAEARHSARVGHDGRLDPLEKGWLPDQMSTTYSAWVPPTVMTSSPLQKTCVYCIHGGRRVGQLQVVWTRGDVGEWGAGASAIGAH